MFFDDLEKKIAWVLPSRVVCLKGCARRLMQPTSREITILSARLKRIEFEFLQNYHFPGQNHGDRAGRGEAGGGRHARSHGGTALCRSGTGEYLILKF